MDDHPRLVAWRRLWGGFVIGVVAVTTIMTVTVHTETTLPAALPLGLAAAVGAVTILAVVSLDRIFAASPPADDDTALLEFRGRLVIQAVIAETAVLLCTVIAVVFGPRWTVVVGGAAALGALARVRPTVRRLARFDAAWGRGDHDVSLRRALRC